MKIVAVISEYNPFHFGHAYHIEKIRREFGDDTVIIAIMSGNFTQRGEVAVADAFVRAEAVVNSGVQLVLKLPFPFSSSSAERFADAGVAIADKLGIVDVLSFGSESGDLSRLERVAERMNSLSYREAIAAIHQQDDDRSIGHPKQAMMIYERLFGSEDADLLTQANNLLAIEYIRALKRRKSSIVCHTVKREGSAYLDAELSENSLPSARAIRASWTVASDAISFEKGLNFIPESSRAAYIRAFEAQEMPADISRLSNVALAFLRNIIPTPTICPIDGAGGLYHHVCKKAWDASNIEEVIRLSCTKKYTAARIRRLVLYALVGITSSDLAIEPFYTQILAMDIQGQHALKHIKKQGSIEILTKPADYIKLSLTARHQAEVDLRSDELFSLAKPVVSSGGASYRRTPYLKKTN